MQLVVLSAVMMEAMIELMIWRMVFQVSFFMVLDVFYGLVNLEGAEAPSVRFRAPRAPRAPLRGRVSAGRC